MKPNDWTECKLFQTAIEITSDEPKSKSLKETAKARINFIKTITPTEENANFLFEGYYNSLIELLHSHLVKKGLKVENHICVAFYIRDEIKNQQLYNLFDDCRYKRNSIIYYGKLMQYDTAMEAIRNCKKLIEEVTKL